MHKRIVRVRSRPVAIRCKCRILIVLAFADIAVCLPLDTGLEGTLDLVPPLVPVVFEGGGDVQFLRVYDLVGEIGQRQPVRKEVTSCLGVHCRLVGSEGFVFVVPGQIVVVVY